MLLAGQNKYWGKTVEEATKLWSNFGITHVMIKNAEDIPLISPKGIVRKEDFKRLGELQKEYDVRYHLHPYNLFVNFENNTYNLDCVSDKTKGIFTKVLRDFDRSMQENSLYPLITLHLPVLDYPGSKEKQKEEKALKNGKEFFQSLDLETPVDLEVVHDPYRNSGWSLLGYRAWHFSEIVGSKRFSLSIDTGHLNLAEEHLKKFVDLGYPITSLHLHGNNGKGDMHEIPNRNNIKDVELVEKLLKKVKGPIVLEIQNHNYSRDDILKLIENTKAGKIV